LVINIQTLEEYLPGVRTIPVPCFGICPIVTLLVRHCCDHLLSVTIRNILD